MNQRKHTQKIWFEKKQQTKKKNKPNRKALKTESEESFTKVNCICQNLPS